MKKLLVIPLIVFTLFSFGCNSVSDNSAVKSGEVSQNNSVADSEKLTFNYCISASTAVYGECENKQLNEISVKLKIGHWNDFAYYRLLDPENSEFNNVGILREIYGVELKQNSELGEYWDNYISGEAVYEVNDFLDDKYDFNNVKMSSDWLTTDKFGKDLDDGIYFVNYNIGVLNENGEVDCLKFVWGDAPLQIFIEKSGSSFNAYTVYEWYLKRIAD